MRRVLANTSVVWCSFDELRELVVDRCPHLARHHRFERRGRHHQVDVALAHVAGVDDRCGAGPESGKIVGRIRAERVAAAFR